MSKDRNRPLRRGSACVPWHMGSRPWAFPTNSGFSTNSRCTTRYTSFAGHQAARNPSVKPLRSASTTLGLNRQTIILLVAILVIGSGEEMWMRFLPKYLEALGASVFLIAAFDAIKTLLGAVYAYPGGLVSDRLGHRAAFVAFTAVSIAGYLLFGSASVSSRS